MLFFTTIFYKNIAKHKNFLYLCAIIAYPYVAGASIHTFRGASGVASLTPCDGYRQCHAG